MSAKQPRQSGPRQGGRQQQQQPQQQQQAQPQQAQAAVANGASAAAAAAPAAKQQTDGQSPTAAATNGAVLNDETRLLVDWHHVGAIIGKGGASVKSIREESGCAINIIAPSPSAPSPQQIDRIMSIRGTVEQTTKAIFLIAHTIQARAAERKAAGQEDSRAAHRGARDLADGTTAIKLLVHRAAVGAVIGKVRAHTHTYTRTHLATKRQHRVDQPAQAEGCESTMGARVASFAAKLLLCRCRVLSVSSLTLFSSCVFHVCCCAGR
jgi:predicted RNA-binding protein YlqC (UPF0109 family)